MGVPTPIRVYAVAIGTGVDNGSKIRTNMRCPCHCP